MTSSNSSPALATAGMEDALYKRVAWRLLPILMLAYMIAFIDRVNVGFAKLQMQDALGFSEAVFGLGAGLMFVGYCLLEVPSNLLLVRIGVRKTFLRIMVLWGLCTVAMIHVTTPMQFYIARFLLGAFEAGLVPGVILYLTFWFPEHRRGRAVGIFMTASLIGNVLAGPLSGAAMKYLDGVNGLAGWQWLYITQGVPAILLGFVVYWWLDDNPSKASWLSDPEKRIIASQTRSHPSASFRDALTILKDPRALGLVLIGFLIIGGQYTMVFWVPTLIKSWGVADVFNIGLLSAIPSILGVVGIVLLTRHSDLKRERRWHFATATAISALGLWLTTVTQGQLIPSLLALSFASLGIASTIPVLVTAVAEYMPPRLRAVGIPLMTSLWILGGFASPALTGMLNTRMGTPIYSMYLMIGLFVLAGLLLLVVLPAAGHAAFVKRADA